MERIVFGIRKVTVQNGKQPQQVLNNRLWGYQVSPGQLELKQRGNKLNQMLHYEPFP